MATAKRLSTLLLSTFVLCAMAFVCAIPAHAVSIGSVRIFADKGVNFDNVESSVGSTSSGKIYYHNGDTNPNTNSSNWNAKVDYDAGVLYLKNYNGGPIRCTSDGLIIQLEGTNTITAEATGDYDVYGLRLRKASITSSDGTGKLIIKSSGASGSTRSKAFGIQADPISGTDSLSIYNCSVQVEAKSYGEAFGIRCIQDLNIGTSGTTRVDVSATGLSSDYAARGVYLEKGAFNLDRPGTMNITCTVPSSGSQYGLETKDISSTNPNNGKIAVAGSLDITMNSSGNHRGEGIVLCSATSVFNSLAITGNVSIRGASIGIYADTIASADSMNYDVILSGANVKIEDVINGIYDERNSVSISNSQLEVSSQEPCIRLEGSSSDVNHQIGIVGSSKLSLSCARMSVLHSAAVNAKTTIALSSGGYVELKTTAPMVGNALVRQASLDAESVVTTGNAVDFDGVFNIYGTDDNLGYAKIEYVPAPVKKSITTTGCKAYVDGALVTGPVQEGTVVTVKADDPDDTKYFVCFTPLGGVSLTYDEDDGSIATFTMGDEDVSITAYFRAYKMIGKVVISVPTNIAGKKVSEVMESVKPVSATIDGTESTDSACSITDFCWEIKEGGTTKTLSNDYVFTPGTNYYINFNLKANPGYKISSSCEYRTSDGTELNKSTDVIWQSLNITADVSFDANGGTGTMEKRSTSNVIFTLPSCGFTAPTGYKFAGWSLAAGGTAIGSSGDRVDITKDTTLYAVWSEIPRVNITFDACGGTGEMPSKSVEEKSTVELPECSFTYPGKKFLHWSTSPSGPACPDNKVYAGDGVTVYAVWETLYYTIKFPANGGNYSSLMSDKTVTYGDFKLPECTYSAPYGKYFFGWSTNAGAAKGDYVPGDTVKITESTTFYPIWGSVKLCLDSNGIYSGNYASYTFYYCGVFNPTTPLPEGLAKPADSSHVTFKGWSDNPNGVAFTSAKIFAEQTTLYAVYERDYKYKYEYDGGYPGAVSVDSPDMNVTHYSTTGYVTLPSNGFAAPDGMTFTGWIVDSDGTIMKPGETLTLTSDLTIKAAWHKCSENLEHHVEKATFGSDGREWDACKLCDYTEGETAIAKLAGASLSETTVVYNGSVRVPTAVVKDSAGAVISAADCTVIAVTNCKAVGIHTVSIAFKSTCEKYAGSVTKTFVINPAKASVKSAKVGKTGSKKLTVKMAKKASAYGASGFQIRYKVKGAKKWKTVKVTKQSKVIKKLKKGKKYQLKVRAYKKVSGKTYYGAWSKVKTTKKIK